MGRSENYSFLTFGPFDLNHLEEEHGFMQKNVFPTMCGGDERLSKVMHCFIWKMHENVQYLCSA